MHTSVFCAKILGKLSCTGHVLVSYWLQNFKLKITHVLMIPKLQNKILESYFINYNEIYYIENFLSSYLTIVLFRISEQKKQADSFIIPHNSI